MPHHLETVKPVIVFLDFDNTVTRVDVLDAVIEKFSINKDWVSYEEAWKVGRIGSRECLEAQLQSVRVSKKDLVDYVRTIALDPFFARLLQLLKRRRIRCAIVSDSFSFIIKTILRHHGVRGIRIFANELRFKKDRLIPIFPHVSKDCPRCAHCKKKHILEHADKTAVYIGDGLSDVCPSLEAEIVFAKDSLLDYLKRNGKACFKFKDLGDVCAFFEKSKRLHPKSEKVFVTV